MKLLTDEEIRIARDRGYKEFEKDMNLMTLEKRIVYEYLEAQAELTRKETLGEVADRLLLTLKNCNVKSGTGLRREISNYIQALKGS